MNFAKSQKTTYAVFWALMLAAVVIAGQFFIPVVTELVSGPVFLLPIAVFSLLGIALMILTVKGKGKGKLNLFLMLTGISSAGFFICIILHNLLYALGMITSHIIILKYMFEVLHVAFFIIGILACPIGFLVGAAGSIVLFIKKRKRRLK